MKTRDSYALYRIAGLLLILGFFVLWQLISLAGIIPVTILPSAAQVLETLLNKLVNLYLVSALLSTVSRMFEAYVLATLIGATIGISMGLNKVADNALDPLIQFVRGVPAVVFLPLAILYFGLGDPMVVSTVVYASVWPIIISTSVGVKSIDPMIIDVARLFGFIRYKKLSKIVLPATAPHILSGMRVSLALSWIVTITAEVFSSASSEGVGTIIFKALNGGDFRTMYATILLAAAAGYAFNWLFVLVETRAFPWSTRMRKGRK